MDDLSSSSSSEAEEEEAGRGGRPATLGLGDGDGGGSLQESVPRHGRRRGPLRGVDELDWADNPLWHSGPPSIGARDIGPLSVRLDDHQAPAGQLPAAPMRLSAGGADLGEASELSLSLLHLLHSADGELMTSTLLSMSSSAESCAALRQSGGLPLVVRLIHAPQTSPPAGTRPRPDRQVRSSASHALHNLVHSQGDDKRARREARVLRLLEQLREFTESLWLRMDEQGHGGMIMEDSMDHHPVPTVVALMKLSFDEEHRIVMCQLGGLYTVAELIQADHEAHGSATAHVTCNSTRRFAGMTLTNLTFGDGTNKALLCGLRGFMRALVAQLHSPNEDLTQVTASVLRNLSWRADAASKQTLREVGAVTALTQAAMAAERESTLKSVLSALWNLSAHCGMNKADICGVDGALAFLVKTLTYQSPSKTTAIVENGGGILRNMSSHIASREDYRAILREHSCLETLLQQLKSSSLTIVSNACGTLWNLSARCAEDQRTLWEMGAVSMLRSLIHSRHQMIAMGSSAALKNLLAARPEGVPPPDAGGNPATPGLPARRLRALHADLRAGGLTETCDNLDAASAGRPEARFLATGGLPMRRVPRSDSGESVLSSLSDPGLERRSDARLAAAVRQAARQAGMTEAELRRRLLRPSAGWEGALPRVRSLAGLERPPLPHFAGRDLPADEDPQQDEDEDEEATEEDAEEIPTEDLPSEDIPAENLPSEDIPVEEIPINGVTADDLTTAPSAKDTSDDPEPEGDLTSDADTVRVCTTDSTLSALSGVSSDFTEPTLTPERQRRTAPVTRLARAISPGSSTTEPSSGYAEYSSQLSDATSSSNQPDSDDPAVGSPFPARKQPPSPGQLRRLVFRGTAPAGRLPPSPHGPRRSASRELRTPGSPQLPRRSVSRELRSPGQRTGSPLTQRRAAERERSGERLAGSPRPQRRSVPRSPSLTRSHTPPGLRRAQAPSPARTSNAADGDVRGRAPSVVNKAADNKGFHTADPTSANGLPVSSPTGRDAPPPSERPGTTAAGQRPPQPSRLMAPGSMGKGAGVRPEGRPSGPHGDGANPAPGAPTPTLASAAAAGDAGGQKPTEAMFQRDQTKEGRTGRTGGSRLPQRVTSGSSLPRRPTQTWSVKQYHRRSERQPGGDGDLTLEDLEGTGLTPRRAERPTRTATLPPEWTAASAQEAVANAGNNRVERSRGDWGARLFAADGTPLSRSSSVGSLGTRSDEERTSSGDEPDARLLERCLRAALPKSRSEGSCLRRPRRGRRRRSPVPLGVTRTPSEESEEEEGEEDEPPPPPPPPPPRQAAAQRVERAQRSPSPSPPPPPPPPTVEVTAASSLSLTISERSVSLAGAAAAGLPPVPIPAIAAEPDCMTASQRVARDASAVAAALEMSHAVMAQSTDLTSSLEMLEGVGPPSMMDSGASFNGFPSSGSLSNGRSPLLPRRPSASSRFVPEMMRRALGGGSAGGGGGTAPPGMQESVEGLSSLSSCQSNLDLVKPPSFMEELDMENSMLSLDSIRSEVAEPRGAPADSLAALEPPSLFHELGEPTERCDSTLGGGGPGSETLGSDTEMCAQEELPLDPPELPRDSTPEASPMLRRRTPHPRRRRSDERYRTFTRGGGSEDASSADLTLTLTPGAESTATETDETLRASASVPGVGPAVSVTGSARARRTCRQRRQDDRERYRTQTVESGSDDLQRPTAEETPSPPSPAAPLAPAARLEIRQLAQEALQRPAPAAGRRDLRQLAAEAQRAIACLQSAGRGGGLHGDAANAPLPHFPAVPTPLTRRIPVPVSASAHANTPALAPAPAPVAAPVLAPPAEHEPEESEQASEPTDSSPVKLRPRIVKPGEETRREPADEDPDQPRGIRGKRKPLYSAPRRSDAAKRDAPSTPARTPAKSKSAAGRSSSASSSAVCPVRGTKTTQLRKVISGSAVAGGGGGSSGSSPLARVSRSATPSPANSATSSPQLGLRRFGSAGKAGVVSRELPRPASTPSAAGSAGRGATKRPVSVPVTSSASRLQRPAWVGAVKPARSVTSTPVKRPAPATPAAPPAPATPTEPTPPQPPATLKKQGTFTLDEPTQEQTVAEAEAEAEAETTKPRIPPPAPTRNGKIARALSAQLSRPPSGARPPPKSHSGQALSSARSRIPKSPSYESTLSLKVRCASQSPGARRQRPASPRRGRALRQSASNSSIGGRTPTRGERSASNSSVSSTTSAGGGGGGGLAVESSGKIAALWRRIEASRARQEQQQQPAGGGGQDGRVWIKPAAGDANANRPAETPRTGTGLTEGTAPRSRMVFTPQGWRRMTSPAQSPTEARPNATAVIPPFNYSPPGGGARSITGASGDNAEKRKRKSAALGS